MSRLRAALLAGLLAGGLLTLASPPYRASAAVITRTPFGLSLEYPLMERALGSGPCPGPTLVSTLRNLGSPTLRIGGDSQDLAGPTPAYHYYVPPSFWPTLGCLARETGAQLVVGLNFAEGPIADEQTTIAAAERAIPALQLTFSLGNEPDLYGISHILPNEPGFEVPQYRPSPWTAGEYASEWATRRAQLGAIKIEGPDLAGIGWRGRIAQLLQSDPPNTMTVHAYPTVACGTSGPVTTATRLLSEHASVGLVEKYDWLLATARAAHRGAVISESNSASCGGKPGVSDTPVAAVWAARYVVAALLRGWSQVRFHAAATSYDPLVFETDGAVAVSPLGHALLFLHRWIPVGSRISTLASPSTAAPLKRHPRGGESKPTTPDVLAATVTTAKHTTVIVSSFESKPISFAVHVGDSARHARTETLTRTSALEARGSVKISAHEARLVLAPNTVVAVVTR
ncbi:MAG TPA: hypothetical protein VGI26_10215 [Solirubrobacteraceae bacterium]|jgi:hypothetical protein